MQATCQICGQPRTWRICRFCDATACVEHEAARQVVCPCCGATSCAEHTALMHHHPECNGQPVLSMAEEVELLRRQQNRWREHRLYD